MSTVDPNFKYLPQFIDGGRVGLEIKHPNPSKDELLIFETLDDMEICAGVRTYIPLEVWATMAKMYSESQSFHNPKHIF